MNRRIAFGVITTSLLCTSACLVDHDAASVELQWVSAPSASCQFNVGNPAALTGFFDPLQPNNGYYAIAFQTRNNMALASTDATTFGPLANARDQGTGVNFIGFEGCWYLFDGTVSDFGANSSGAYVDCTQIPEQSGSLAAVSQTDAGAGQGLVGTNVLTANQLKSIFGSDFDVASIAADSNNFVGYVYDAVTNAHKFVPRLKAPGAAGSGRLAAWGQNYPATLTATIVVQLRGQYSKQGGGNGYTNWVSFPIEFCPSCLNDLCGDNLYYACDTICPNNAYCSAQTTPGVCTGATTSCYSYLPFYSAQNYLFWGESGVCLPAQNSAPTTFTCESKIITPAVDPNLYVNCKTVY